MAPSPRRSYNYLMVHSAVQVAFALGLSLAIAVGVVAACHGILRLFRNRETPKPRLLVVSAVWLLAVFTLEGYEIWRGWAAYTQINELNTLATQAYEEAKQLAKSKGEDVSLPGGYGLPAGPIFQKEYGERYVKAEQQTHRVTDFSFVENIIPPLWLICGLSVAGYYAFVLRKPSGWFLSIVISATLTLFQLIAIGLPVVVLSFFFGGPE